MAGRPINTASATECSSTVWWTDAGRFHRSREHGWPAGTQHRRQGFDTVVADLDEAKVATVVSAGATAAPDAIAAVAGADVVLTSLPGPKQVRSIADQILPVMAAGSIWIDLSTNDLDCARYVADLAAEHGVRVMDAPVSGGVEGAQAGTLSALVGGDRYAPQQPPRWVLGRAAVG